MSALNTVLRTSWPLAAGFGAMVFGLYACQPHENLQAATLAPVAGADRDAKGCIGSAGYGWSALQSRCLRVFEEGLAFGPTPDNPDKTLQAFVLIHKSATAGSKAPVAELFWPGQAEPIALSRASGHTETVLDGVKSQIQLVRNVSDYQIVFKGQALFARPMHTSESLTALR